MRRDHMLMEAILGQLLQSPERLNVEQPVIRHHLCLLQDRNFVHEAESGVWRLTSLGHDYLEGTPQQAISLNLPSR